MGKEAEVAATEVLKEKNIAVCINLKDGPGCEEVFTCDFSIDYVKINAETIGPCRMRVRMIKEPAYAGFLIEGEIRLLLKKALLNESYALSLQWIMKQKYFWSFLVWFVSVFFANSLYAEAEVEAGLESPTADSSQFSSKNEWDIFDQDRWTLQFGVAMITENVIGDISLGEFERATGDAGGEMYLFSASYNLFDFDWKLWDWRFRPQLELPMVFGVVNERGRSPFFDYNVGITLRWKDFPSNELVYVNIETGIGLSYTEHVLAIERERHPERDRSHLKFYWPIQLMLAHPKRKEHQLILFIHHQSGGHIFDVGGSNLLGIGYRHVFRER